MARKSDPEGVLDDLREAIRPEVKAEVKEESKGFRRNQWVTYFVILVLLVVGLALISAQADKNHRAIVQINAFRAQRSRDTAATDVEICAKQNTQNAILAGLLEESLRSLPAQVALTPPAQRATVIKLVARIKEKWEHALLQLRPVDCRALPSRPGRGADPGVIPEVTGHHAR